MIETAKRVLIAPAEVAYWIGWPVAAATMKHPLLVLVFFTVPSLAFCIWYAAHFGDWSAIGVSKFLGAYLCSSALIQLAARPAHIWLSRH